MRSRVVAGMCEAVVVVESGSNGGSLMLLVLLESRGVGFVLPGRVDQSTSTGCRNLSRDGATLVTCT